MSVATIGSVFAIWTVVFGLWKFGPAHLMLNKYFLQVSALPSAFSVFGNTFSHQNFLHMAANMTAIAVYGISGTLLLFETVVWI